MIFIIFPAIFIIYFLCLFPSIGGGDSAELVSVAASLGVAHPPGYPLYTMLAHFFTYIPWGSIAWRINLFSAVCSTGAALFLYLAIQKITKDKKSAAMASFAYAVAPLIWTYSELAEVFALNNLFASLLLYVFILIQIEGRKIHIFLFYFLAGLALSHHHTIVLLFFPLAIAIELKYLKSFSLKAALAKAICTLLGLSPYLYLFIRSQDIPLFIWGDPSTLDGFIQHILRRDYGTFQLSSAIPATDVVAEKVFAVFLLLKHLTRALAFVGWIPLIYGFAKLREKKRLLIPVFCGLLLYMVVFIGLANLPLREPSLAREVVSRFWILPFLLIFFFVGLGLHHLQNLKWVFPLALATLVFQVGYNWKSQDQSGNHVFEDYCDYLFKPLPQNALLFLNGDLDINGSTYFRYVEGKRQDLEIINRVLLAYPWSQAWADRQHPTVQRPGKLYNLRGPGGYDAQMIVAANPNRPIYFSDLGPEEAPISKKAFVFFPYGLDFKPISIDANFEIEKYLADSTPLLVDPDMIFPRKPEPDEWEFFVYDSYWLAHERQAFAVLEWAELKHDTRAYLEFARLTQAFIQKRPSGINYKNLGATYARLAQLVPDKTGEYQKLTKAAFAKYLATNPPHDQDFENIQRIVATPAD